MAEVLEDNLLENMFENIAKSVISIGILEKKYAKNITINETCSNLVEIISVQLIPKLAKTFNAYKKCHFRTVHSNGYRSFLILIDRWIRKIIKINNKVLVLKNRLSLLNEIGEQISKLMSVCIILCDELETTSSNCLFVNINNPINNLINSSDIFISDCIYKELLGFH